MKIYPVFAWYDLWVGAYWDRKSRDLYILPLPMIGIRISFEQRSVTHFAYRYRSGSVCGSSKPNDDFTGYRKHATCKACQKIIKEQRG